MTLLLRNLELPLKDDESALAGRAARELRVARQQLRGLRPVKRSLDARRGRPPHYVYTVAIDLEPDIEAALLTRKRRSFELYQTPPSMGIARLGVTPRGSRPVVVGAGPAGLLTAYRLAQAGAPPIVIERGEAVKERSITWHAFLTGRRPFDRESNLLFGEGGAGTYSDGKLYTRVHDPRVAEVLRLFVECGAPAEIAYEAKPHIGSNLLPSVVRRLRERLIASGVEFRFSTRCEAVLFESAPTPANASARRVIGVELAPGGRLETETVFLGIGHSARDTLRELARSGVAMEAKPFQLGVRVEHQQQLINEIQYAEHAGHPHLPPADYRLVAKRAAGDVFSFCMCPGGEILPATEQPGFICVNGASRYKRIGDYANSGFVITLEPEQFPNPSDPLSGVTLQEEIESRAALVASAPFAAPALRLEDFLAGRRSADLPASSYPLALVPALFDEFMPSAVTSALREGLETLCRQLRRFRTNDAIVVGPESRSSSPVRLVRDAESMMSPSALGLYPMGEGAGYAGGIMSAAIDGMLCAEAYARHALARAGISS
ncbi:MAG: FAD-dependent protein [Planctomycetota bacterium]